MDEDSSGREIAPPWCFADSPSREGGGIFRREDKDIMDAVIMAGGSGRRFWPLSRSRRPKQFLDIIGGEPMIVTTFRRVKDLVGEEHVTLVVGEEHEEEARRLFEPFKVNLLVEPAGRNTAPCIGLAARFIAASGRNDPVAVLPADHFIARPETFLRGLGEAATLAREGAIATLGIVPTRPETGYGYIQQGKEARPVAGSARPVRRFVEKPDMAKARSYLADGDFYWNAGVFVATPETLLEELAAHLPAFARELEKLDPFFNTPELSGALRALYRKTPRISFDVAVMEKTSRPVYVVPCDCGWSDVGSWESLHEARKAGEGDSMGNVVEGEVRLMDCRGSMAVSRGGRWVTGVGLENILVVDTGDALLVADLKRSQEIKELTEELERAGLERLL